eukprot:TRINITY_DN10383_c0_g1_i8.p1 TRINITY_DN10383_c0_g1~~TRINITY_DN10383_c0_g1_i8.p1  ORF type:complete len:215 (+),score=27.71 TRINITY_DN10383_c0_g1_i8:65-709(+)
MCIRDRTKCVKTTDDGISSVFSSISSEKLKALHISLKCCSLITNGIQPSLCELLRRSGELSHLHLCFWDCSPSSTIELTSLLSSLTTKNLERLDLILTSISSESVQALASFLGENQSLREVTIWLYGCKNLEENHIISIIDSLKGNELQSIELNFTGCNSLTDQNFCKAIERSFTKLKQLKYLEILLYRTQITEEGRKSLLPLFNSIPFNIQVD